MPKKKVKKFLINKLGVAGGMLSVGDYSYNSGVSWADDFGGTSGNVIASAPISDDWTLFDWYAQENSEAPAHDERETINGRLRIRIQDNSGNSGNGKSLIWRTGGNDYYGAIYYKLLTPPFDVALLGCRIASQSDPLTFVNEMITGGEFAFIGLALRHPDLTADYEHVVVGYRGGVETVEWKRRSGPTSVSQGDPGPFASNEAVGDVRVSVASNGIRTWYYREEGAALWTELVTNWNSVAEPTLQNTNNQIAVGIQAYAFDNFVPDSGYYVDQAIVI